jgi:hypothetical protein
MHIHVQKALLLAIRVQRNKKITRQSKKIHAKKKITYTDLLIAKRLRGRRLLRA